MSKFVKFWKREWRKFVRAQQHSAPSVQTIDKTFAAGQKVLLGLAGLLLLAAGVVLLGI